MPRPSVPPIRTAIVGTGHIADAVHMPTLRSLGADVVVEAAMDVDTNRLTAFATKWGITAAYDDLAGLLKEAHPDLVIICSPPVFHREQVLAVLDAGAWAWCEKPPVLSLAEYDEIVAAEPDGGPYASVVFQQRFGSGARHTRRLLSSGRIGRPLVAHCQTTWYRDDAYYDVAWRGRWTGEGGGPAMGLGIHQIDLLLDLIGPWSEVRGHAARLARDVQTDDVTTATVRFETGALATVVSSAVSPRQTSYLRIDCEGGTIELDHLYGYHDDDWTYTPAPGTTPEVIASWKPPGPDEPSTHLPQLTTLLADIRAGRRPATSGPGGREALEFITAMYKSAFTGRPVQRGEIVPGDPFYAAVNGGHDIR
ncbi:Gfo/Idh/MocA family protein [Phytoactinopolyspora limicola]|uniref:Gfo/Idh/MocA family protein n=1 Tax=Phytoactinopolyspora limicola TaxID=2715536 RepID=UPI001A9C76E1|nr:Gfo/Idh/MocA family oxidoreductase [Phytoactinopolyspora limicola]